MADYNGERIWPCRYTDSKDQGYRWYIPRERDGFATDEPYCPRFDTIVAAQEFIDWENESNPTT